MTDKELHKLSRRDLLQLLLEQGRETEELKRQLSETEEILQRLEENYERLRKRLDKKDEQIHRLRDMLQSERTKRKIELSEAGSIAEAALRLNVIFDAAQKAADQYLYNIKLLHGGETPEPELQEVDFPEDSEEIEIREIGGEDPGTETLQERLEPDEMTEVSETEMLEEIACRDEETDWTEESDQMEEIDRTGETDWIEETDRAEEFDRAEEIDWTERIEWSAPLDSRGEETGQTEPENAESGNAKPEDAEPEETDSEGVHPEERKVRDSSRKLLRRQLGRRKDQNTKYRI